MAGNVQKRPENEWSQKAFFIGIFERIKDPQKKMVMVIDLHVLICYIYPNIKLKEMGYEGKNCQDTFLHSNQERTDMKELKYGCCKRCRNRFQVKNYNQVFCSNECRNNTHNETKQKAIEFYRTHFLQKSAPR